MRSGRGLAIAGIILGATVLVIAVVGIVAVVLERADRDATGAIVDDGVVSVMNLQVGDCLVVPDGDDGEGDVFSMQAVPCTDPHNTQILVSFALSGNTFPGTNEVAATAEDRCGQLVPRSLNEASDAYDLGLYYVYPTQESWTQLDDREVLCGVSSVTDITETVLEGSGS